VKLLYLGGGTPPHRKKFSAHLYQNGGHGARKIEQELGQLYGKIDKINHLIFNE
jgi:hypothetical protein